MTIDAEPLAWRASAGRVAWIGWVLGALGGAATLCAAVLEGWALSSSVGDAAILLIGLVPAALAGAPIGGVGGLWAAGIVLALRGRTPAQRRGERLARTVATAVLLAAGVVAIVVLDVIDALAAFGSATPKIVALALGAAAIVRILLLAGRVDHGAGTDGAAVPSEPWVLGAVLGPIATAAGPLLAFATRDGLPTSLPATAAGFAALPALAIGPLVGLAFAAFVDWPWDGSDGRPRTRGARVAVVVTLQVVVAGMLALLAHAMVAGDGSALAAVVGGVVLLGAQLALLAAAWRSHARHAEDLSRSR